MESAQFQEALRHQTPRVWVTPTLLAANVIVFGLMAAKGVNPVQPSAESLIPWGADYGPLTLAGEWWRLLTSMFLHFGIIHLAMNMFVLWGAGGFVERLYGNVPYLAIYLCAGLAGSVASESLTPNVVSAGASGAVFGVYGALGAYLLRYRRVIPAASLRSLAQSTIIFILYNVLYGFSRRGIDNGAHLGGLAGGFVFGLIQAAPLGATIGPRLARTLVLPVLAVGIAFAALHSRPAPPDFLRQEKAAIALYNEVDQLDTRARERYNGLVKPKDPSQGTTGEVVANVVENEILPEYAELRGRLEALPPSIASLSVQPELVARYVRAEEAAWRLMAEGLRADDGDRVEKGLRELEQAGDLFKRKQ